MENKEEKNNLAERMNIDLSIRILLIVVLFAWCIMIILPFVIPVLWGVILAITLYPLYKKLLNLLDGKRALASTITTGILLLLLIVPLVWLISSVVQSAGQFITSIREQTLVIPPPKPSVADWPLIGEPVYNTWLLVTTNIEAVIRQYSDQIITAGDKFLGAIKSVASNFLLLIFSIIISGILLAGSEKSERGMMSFAARIGGVKGAEFIDLIVLTIRNVAKGILGVAFIQFILLGAAYVVAGVPFAGLWAIFVLLLSIVQLPSGIVSIPVIIYLFTVREPLPAVLWTVLIVVLSLSDNFLKPWLMGMGAPVPMLVIFLGAIGGMIMSGFIGLFTGAIILSLGYKLATIWMSDGIAEPKPE
jgi:predicted PurR-regulated permease PerM